MDDALIVFGKQPEPGTVKTRLIPLVGAAGAARLYAAFLADSLERFSQADADVRLYWSGDRATIADVPPGTAVLDQKGGDLGERLLHAMAETFAAGYARVVVVGTDHPTLPLPFLEEAFRALADPRSVVIGPATDGGYYLIGMNDLRPEPFRGITFSRPDVFERTLDRLKDTRAALTILPFWYDVDEGDDLTRLAADLSASPELARRTHAVLQELSLVT